MDAPRPNGSGGREVGLAERFEDEKRRIVDSCFNKKDTDGSLLETYITHIRIMEYSSHPSSPPPPEAITPQSKKPRVMIVAVRKSGRVRMHKSRENANGTFSIGKSWEMNDLTGIESFTSTSVDPRKRQRAGDTGFILVFGKPYFWQCSTDKEKKFFIASLIKIYSKYTGGKLPELHGFDPREQDQVIGSRLPPRNAAVAGTAPPSSPRPGFSPAQSKISVSKTPIQANQPPPQRPASPSRGLTPPNGVWASPASGVGSRDPSLPPPPPPPPPPSLRRLAGNNPSQDSLAYRKSEDASSIPQGNGDYTSMSRIPNLTGAPSQATFRDSALGTSIAHESSKHSIAHKTDVSVHNMATMEEFDEMLELDTIYTQGSNDSVGQKTHDYKIDLAARLHHELSHWANSQEDIARVSVSLPRLLQSFAFKIAKEGEGEKYRDTKRFMLKHRRSVAYELAAQARASLEPPLQSDTDSKDCIEVPEEVLKSRTLPSMSYAEKIEGWNPAGGVIPDPETPLEPNDGETESERDSTDEIQDLDDDIWEVEVDEFSRLVTESRAYQWLLIKIQNELELENPPESAALSLSEKLFRILNEKQISSRKSTPRRIEAVFEAEWSPNSFFEEQEYGVPPEKAVLEAFVVVGTTTRAEGLACGEYLLRQWPESAPTFIQVVQSIVKSTEGISHSGILSDDTTIQASVKEGRITMEVCGHPDSVIEIGEQLMWLSCALRSSDFSELGTCEPSVGEISIIQRSKLCVSVHIQLAATPKLAQLVESQDGTCWHELFRNPLAVTGYPIHLRNPAARLGLQLSLGTLMALVQNSRLVSYMGKLFIKAFSTLLVAVKLVDNVILWHTVSNKDGSYIHYHDKRVGTLGVEVTSSLLQQVDITEMKHVVGWTPNADNLAGTRAGLYHIRLSGLANSRPLEIELEKLTLGFSKIFAGNVSVKFGWRDKPIHARDEGDDKLNIKHISKHFVVLYDVEDHRGFLLDGATALLHLVRASIIEDQDDGLISSLHDDRTINDCIQLDNDPDPKRRAMKTLWSDDNACLKLYKRLISGDTKTETKTIFQIPSTPQKTIQEIHSQEERWVFFRDRVCDIRWMLDQAINIQTDDTALKASVKSFIGKTKLEGYEFQDLASSKRADLQFATPESNSQGWLDLVRRLQAVTLFGRGFGEIIQHNDCAAHTHVMCPGWKSVPTDHGYLVMSSTTLKSVLERDGSDLWRLQNPFEPCKPKVQTCDRKHFLIASQNQKAQARRLEIPEQGAVVIGYETSPVSRFIQSISTRQMYSNDTAIITTRASMDSHQLQNSLSEDTSREAVSTSSAAGSTDIVASATSNTTAETPQDGLGRSGFKKHQHLNENLATLNIANAELIAPPGLNINAELAKKSQSMRFTHSNTDIISPDFNQEEVQISDPSSQDDTKRGTRGSNTVVAAASPPSTLQPQPNPENAEMVSDGRTQSFHRRFRQMAKHLQLRPPKRNDK